MSKESHFPKTIGVILGAGMGTRMRSKGEPKQFLNLEGMPIFLYSIQAFDSCPCVDEIVAVVPPGMTSKMRSILQGRRFRLPIEIIAGGKRRQDSSFKALQRLSKRNDVGVVAIHDAARPLIPPDTIERLIREAERHGAATVAAKCTDTVLEVEKGFITCIPDRGSLYRAQTPQAFRFDIIREGHKAARRDGLCDATDDVQLVVRLGRKVKLVEGPPENMKITTSQDLRVASLIVRDRRRRRKRQKRGAQRSTLGQYDSEDISG